MAVTQRSQEWRKTDEGNSDVRWGKGGIGREELGKDQEIED